MSEQPQKPEPDAEPEPEHEEEPSLSWVLEMSQACGGGDADDL